MKNLLVVKLCGALLILFIAGSLQAQETGIKTLPPITVTSSAGVSQKVSEAFQSSFKNAVNPTWYRLNKQYLVEFITGDINNRALFQKNGNMIYHIRYGHENNLPKEVRRLVKSNYVDFNIVQAINVLEDNRDIWVVSMEGENKLIMARVEDGTLEEVSNLNKSSK
jgi:hypothetical protein